MHLPSPPAPLHRGRPAAPEEPELPLVSRPRAGPAAMGTVVTQSDAYEQRCRHITEQRCHIAERDVTPPHGCYCPPFVAGSQYPPQELQMKLRRGVWGWKPPVARSPRADVPGDRRAGGSPARACPRAAVACCGAGRVASCRAGAWGGRWAGFAARLPHDAPLVSTQL